MLGIGPHSSLLLLQPISICMFCQFTRRMGWQEWLDKNINDKHDLFGTVKNSSITTRHLYLILTIRSHHEIFIRRSWYSVLPSLDSTISCRIKKAVVGWRSRDENETSKEGINVWLWLMNFNCIVIPTKWIYFLKPPFRLQSPSGILRVIWYR